MAQGPRQVAAKRGKAAAPRAWQRMLSGRRLDLLDPSPLDVEIEDIAHGLARVARWNGQTFGAHAFSVAQHSVVVETLAGEENRDWPAQWRLAALLHDAAEYVIGDMISPFKAALGLDYRAFEDRISAAVHIRFGLPPRLPPAVVAAVKLADRRCAYLEAVQLAGFGVDEARIYFEPPPAHLMAPLAPLPADAAQQAFMERFQTLFAQAGD